LFFQIADFALNPYLTDFNFHDVFNASKELSHRKRFSIGHASTLHSEMAERKWKNQPALLMEFPKIRLPVLCLFANMASG
jgi:hypothetical protein